MSVVEIIGLVFFLWLVFLGREGLIELLFGIPGKSNAAEEPAPDSQDPLEKTAVVRREFGGVATSLTQEGTVELNGVEWSAETRSPDAKFSVDDRVRVESRDGLTLFVTGIDDG